MERGILAATVLLPILGKLAKGGRALYTEARLVKLYGRDAGQWGKVLDRSGKIVQDSKKLATIRDADKVIRSGHALDAKLVDEAAKALDVVKDTGGAVSRAVDSRVTDALTAVSGVSQGFAILDAFALERVLLKGPNVSHLKGQILEELLESKIVPWLRQRWGGLPSYWKYQNWSSFLDI